MKKVFLFLSSCLFSFISVAQVPLLDDDNWDTTTPVLSDDFNTFNTTTWQNGLGWNDSARDFLSITNVTYSGTTVTVTTAANHGLVAGDKVTLKGITGFTSTPSLNYVLYTVTTVSGPSLFSFSVTSISGTYTGTSAAIVVDYFFYNNTANVYIDNSHLVLLSDYNASRLGGKVIHSGAISSRSTYGYGYYQINCKLNSEGIRYLPAFWNIASDGNPCSAIPSWYNENDFFEAYQETIGSTIYNLSSNFWFREDNCTLTNSYMANTVNGTDLYSQFHTYGYEWTADRVIFYLDNVPYRSVTGSFVANHTLQLVMDLGIKEGAGWNDKIGTDYLGVGNTGKMIIDNVNIYKLKLNAATCATLTPETVTTFDPGTFTYNLKQSLTVGNSTNFTTQKETLRAVDFISITGGTTNFTVPLGAELTLLPTNCE